MARPTTSPSHPPPAATLEDLVHDAAAAAVDADVQTHHRLLLCLEQTRRAQEKMVHDWMRDGLASARALASSTDHRPRWQAPAVLAWAMCASAFSAQATVLAAWSEYQRSVLEQARASNTIASGLGWFSAHRRFGDTAQGADAAVEPSWVNDAMETYDRFAAAWTSVWDPQGRQTRH